MTLEAPLWIQLGSFASQNDRLLIDTLTTDGVLDGRADPVTVLPASPDLACTPNIATLSVDVAAGVAVITGTDQTRQGKYVCRSTATTTVALDPRPAGGQTRIDIIYAQVLDSSSGIVITPGTDGWVIGKVTGVPSGSSPTVPNPPTSSLVLAQVNVTAAGGGTLTDGDITDRRHRALSRGAPIAKQLKTQTVAMSGANDFFSSAGPRAVPNADIFFTTYTPNVPLVMAGAVRIGAEATAWIHFQILVGTGPTVLYESNESFMIAPGSSGSMQHTFVVVAPGSYWLHMIGNTGAANVTVVGGWAWTSATWFDIAGPTG